MVVHCMVRRTCLPYVSDGDHEIVLDQQLQVRGGRRINRKGARRVQPEQESHTYRHNAPERHAEESQVLSEVSF